VKLRKLLDKLSYYLQAHQLKQCKSLKDVLKKLKKKRDVLREELSAVADSDERQRIQRKLDVIAVQRQKGLALLKELKEPRH
jgi:hypothetical protein